jgi:hypothetical protein
LPSLFLLYNGIRFPVESDQIVPSKKKTMSIQHKAIIGTLLASFAMIWISNISLVQYLTRRSSSIEMHSWSASEWIKCLQSAADNQVDGMIPSKMNNLYQLGNSAEHKMSPELRAAIRHAAADLEYKGVTENTVLFYVGGNEFAQIAQNMMKRFQFSKTYILEPIPSFVQNLQKVFASEEVNSSGQVKILPFGISDEDATLSTEVSGKGTEVFGSPNKTDCKACEKVVIRDAYKVITEILQENKGQDFIFYSNCEGCEVPVMERMIDTGLVQYFKYIHFATHFVTMPFYESRLC